MVVRYVIRFELADSWIEFAKIYRSVQPVAVAVLMLMVPTRTRVILILLPTRMIVNLLMSSFFVIVRILVAVVLTVSISTSSSIMIPLRPWVTTISIMVKTLCCAYLLIMIQMLGWRSTTYRPT